MKYIVVLSIVLLASCNPCKYVSKHPECFPSDTIKIEKETIRHVKEYITNDSIIYDTIETPILKKIYETIFKTKTIERTDTIFENRYTAKINPINEQLKQSNDKLTKSNKTLKKWLLYTSIGFALALIFIIFLIKIS